MRVLFLTDSLSDLDGVGRYAVRLIRALEALQPGMQVEVLLARKHRPTSADVPGHWKVSVALPPDYFFYMSPARFWASLIASTWRAWRSARRSDVVHAIKDYPHSLVALLAARLAGVPCVATAHGTYSVQPLLSRRHRRLARWTYARFSALISVSRFTATRLAELWSEVDAPALALEVVPNAVDAAPYAAERPRAGAPTRPWDGLEFTLSIGELKERKGHHLALQAWCDVAARHPQLQHFVVGKLSGDPYERELRERVARAGLEARVHFLGNVEEADKIELLRRARVFVHVPVTASDGGFEGFGIVYLEASASGTPVIGTLGCGAEDAIVDGRTGFLVEPRAPAVAAALGRLLDDPALRERMGQAGREHARHSPWSDNARKVLDLYRRARSARAAGAPGAPARPSRGPR